MKRGLWRWLAVLMVVAGTMACTLPSVARAEDTDEYAITYKTDAGHFSNGTDTNVVRYQRTGQAATTTKYSHTPNIDDAGNAHGTYASNLSRTDTVTIPGATKLFIDVWYSTESTSYDWLAIYPAGVTPSQTNYGQASISGGKLGGGSRSTKDGADHWVFTVNGDTAQFYFRSDGSQNYYGYYAVVTDEGWGDATVAEGTYEEPTGLPDGWVWHGWFSDEDHTAPVDPSMLASDATVYGHATPYDHEGTCGTVSWGLKPSGELHFWPTNGTEGTLASNTGGSTGGWPWSTYSWCIKSITSEGIIDGSKNMSFMFAWCCDLTDLSGLADWNMSATTDIGGMFYDCASLTDVTPLAGWDTSSIGSIHGYFSGLDYGLFSECSSLVDVSALADWDTSSMSDMSYMFYHCDSLTTIDLSGWDTHTLYTSAYGDGYDLMFSDGISTVTLGSGITSNVVSQLPDPPSDSTHTGKWIRDDGAGPYTKSELANLDAAARTGTWTWETMPTEYSVTLDANGAFGSMAPSTLTFHVDGTRDVLPTSGFYLIGRSFKEWNTKADGTGHSYRPDTYTVPLYNESTGKAAVANDNVVLYAIWTDTEKKSASGGSFDIMLRAGEQVTIEGLPAGASYEVTETDVPSGWTLVRSQGTTGIILPRP